MKGSKNVIEALNDILTGELTAINQYFLHAKMCQSWGFDRLHEVVYREAIDEMKHAENLIARILFLEGVPNVQRLAKVSIGETVPEQLKLDRALEADAVARMNKAIGVCAEAHDNGSRELLEGMLKSEEAHLDWLETQLRLLDSVGEAPYLAEQLRE